MNETGRIAATRARAQPPLFADTGCRAPSADRADSLEPASPAAVQARDVGRLARGFRASVSRLMTPPWQQPSEWWFDLSALMLAMLLAALVMSLA